MFLGTLVMIYTLQTLSQNYSIANELKINKTLYVLIVLMYPLFDLLRVFVLRIKDGQSPFIADKRHIHHLINNKIKNPILVVLIIQLLFSLMYVSIFV